MKKLTGKTILITGASMGIGYDFVQELAAHGTRPILVARSEGKLKDLCAQLGQAGCQASYYTCDLSNPVEVECLGNQILQEHEALDGIVHNAGIGIYGECETLSLKDIRELFEVNFFSIIKLTQTLLPLLKKSLDPKIMMVSSVVGWRSIVQMSIYCASKFALNGLTEALRLELDAYGIKTIAVYPGRTQTAFTENAKSTGWKPFSTKTHGMSSKKVAKKMLRAYIKGKRDEFICPSNRAIIWGNFLFPRLIDCVLRRHLQHTKKNKT